MSQRDHSQDYRAYLMRRLALALGLSAPVAVACGGQVDVYSSGVAGQGGATAQMSSSNNGNGGMSKGPAGPTGPSGPTTIITSTSSGSPMSSSAGNPQTIKCFSWSTSSPCPPPSQAGQYMSLGPCYSVDGSAPAPKGQCCYLVSQVPCVTGRPFLEQGAAQHASASVKGASPWTAGSSGGPAASGLSDSLRRAIAREWRHDGLFEHASVASFGRFALELLAVGAPPELIAAAHEAALDEVRHARACLELAAAYDGDASGPGAFPFAGSVAVSSDLADIAARAAIEGCVGETIASVFAAEQLARATDPRVREVLAMIARDEASHAELAWRTVAWALAEGGAPVRRALERAFAEAIGAEVDCSAAQETSEPGYAEHGRLDRRAMGDLRDETIDEVVRPCIAALLASPALRAAAS